MPGASTIKDFVGRAVLCRRLIIVPAVPRRLFIIGRRRSTALPGVMGLLIALIVTWSSLVSGQIQQAWVAKYDNGITNGNHQALKMALDSSGNIYVLGVSANANTNTGYAVVKYAPNGNQMWAARYDSTNFPSATPTGFAVDSGSNVVVTGTALTVKYDATGNLLWSVPYPALAIAVDGNQGIYLTGISNSFTTMKFNSSGSNLWTTSSPGNISEAIAVNSSNVYVTGLEVWYTYKWLVYWDLPTVMYDLNTGDPVWREYVGRDVPNIGEGNIVGLLLDAQGRAYIEANISEDGDGPYATLRYDSSGNGGALAGNPTDDLFSLAYGIVIDNSGNILVTGGNDYNYPYNMYGTYKIDTNGNYLWGKTYPPEITGNSVATSIAVDQANSAYVTGFSPSLGTNGDSDIVTIKYASNGNQIWLQRYDGPAHGNDAGNVSAVDNSGNVYVAGYETETNGFTSMILIKYSPVTLQSQPNGNVILHASGSPGETFDIRASTNLQIWQDLGPIIADTNGVISFTDTNAPLFPARFYYTVPR